MILPFLAAMAAIPATPPPAEDIVVTAARLKKIRISADSDDNGRITTCAVTVSSGNAGLDGFACQATRDCAAAGVQTGGAIADCVDHKMIAFASTHGLAAAAENGNHARDQ